MSNSVLVTDSMYIFDEHVRKLQEIGLQVERLNSDQATEEELCEALQDKIGYIVGGNEEVTEAVINAAPELKAIALTHDDWQSTVPAYAHATQKGILISNAPGANAYSVAEYTLMLILMMLRRPLELGSTGTTKGMITGSVVDARIGIIGMGRIAELVARMLVGIGATDVVYWSRQARPDLQQELGIRFMPLEELVQTADAISTHVPNSAGEILSKDYLRATKEGVALINTGSTKTYNNDALFDLLIDQKARAAFDFPIDEVRFEKLTADVWFYSNTWNGYNTNEAAYIASDMATQSLINLLTTGQDSYRVN